MNIIDIGLFVSYLLVVVSVIAAIVLPLIQAASDPKSLAKSGMGVLALVVIFLVGLAFSDGTAYGIASSTTSKLVGAGIITTYLLFFIAVVGIIYTEVSKIVK